MSSNDEADLPVWRREKIFPEKPDSSPYGVVTRKKGAIGFATFEELSHYLAEAKNESVLIWNPLRERCFPAEEEAELLDSLTKRKRTLANEDWEDLRSRALWFLLPVVWAAWKCIQQGKGFHQSQELGLFTVLWLIFAGIPAYEAWKRMRRASRLTEENLEAEAAEVRFEIWLIRQKAVWTKVLAGIIAGIYLVQVLESFTSVRNILAALISAPVVTAAGTSLAGLEEAGLLKPEYRAGEWWRLFTAPLLHGGIVHLVMNGLGLLYLGRRAEVLAGWPHLVLVFLISCLCGGIASDFGLTAPTVGASGGIMGLLGFLLVFEYLHGRLVPQRSMRRLFAGLILTFVVGFIGYQLIDNWAHGGGLLAGLLYAAIVFPPSKSPHRPRPTQMDAILGTISIMLLISAALLTVFLCKAS